MHDTNVINNVTGRFGSRCCGLRKYMLPALFLTAAIVLLFVTVGQTAPAARSNRAPYLDLSGTIVEINRATGYVYVNVASEHCPGRHAFRADNIEKLQEYKGVPIFFVIDSDSCVGAGSETILVSRGVRK